MTTDIEQPRSEPAFTNRTVAKVWRKLYSDWTRCDSEWDKLYIQGMLVWIEEEFQGRKPNVRN